MISINNIAPVHIEFMLHCFYSPVPHPNVRNLGDVIETLLENGVIEPIGGPAGLYGTTDKGEKWVEMICTTPFPVSRWLDPRKQAGV